MKCEDISKELIRYLDRRANSAVRLEVEEHLSTCAACHTRAEEFRRLWSVLDEVPMVEPSAAFDARVHERIAAERPLRWFAWLVPQTRLAFSIAILLALSVWIVKLPGGTGRDAETDFEAVKNLGVLENYDVVTKLDALSELTPLNAEEQIEPAPQDQNQQPQKNADDGGDM
jgi:predicted anti-sigma-YlaC factor YlaD